MILWTVPIVTDNASNGGPGGLTCGRGTEGTMVVYPRWWGSTVVPVSPPVR